VPFLLEGVALNPELNGDDLIHPNAAGARRIADTVWPYLERLVVASAKEANERDRVSHANGAGIVGPASERVGGLGAKPPDQEGRASAFGPRGWPGAKGGGIGSAGSGQ
jgi:hypothetical protein